MRLTVLSGAFSGWSCLRRPLFSALPEKKREKRGAGYGTTDCEQLRFNICGKNALR